MSLGICWWISQLQASRPQLASWLLIGTMLAAAGNIADVCYWRRQQPLPGAIAQPQPTPDSTARWWFSDPAEIETPPNSTSAEAWTADWQAMCAWIDANTPRDALFITPRDQQTFKWYAQRAEVANRKDVPQDARSLVEWRRRLALLYPRDRRHHELGLAAHIDEQLVALGRQFGAQYLVVDRTRSKREILLPKVYPVLSSDNQAFAVYRLPEAETP
jgi:hypothetical protein